jgi:predicted MFS family arabinose efflux permease
VWSRGAPLGAGFGRLWASAAVSNVGDGVALAAGPLLLASLTSDPVLVAGAAFVQQLPWLLFALPAGVLVDRVDRRRLVVLVDLLRAAVVGGLTVAVATGTASVALVYTALFVIGAMETLADNASTALLPALVPAEQLPRANARLMGVQLVGNHLLAPPLGAVMFVAGAALPFGLNAATFLAAAVLIATLPGRHTPASQESRRPLRLDIATGIRALLGHSVLRMLAVCLCLMNVTLMAAFAILVLYARERLGLSEVGFGVLLAASAAGGIAGTVVAARLQARFGTAWLLRVGLVIETCTHLSLALTRVPWIAITTMVVFGAHASLWGILTLSWRQRVVPDALRGRINSGYSLLSVGGAAIGAIGGGLVARGFGITAPFWIAFGGMVLVTVVAWRHFTPARLDVADPLPLAVHGPTRGG